MILKFPFFFFFISAGIYKTNKPQTSIVQIINLTCSYYYKHKFYFTKTFCHSIYAEQTDPDLIWPRQGFLDLSLTGLSQLNFTDRKKETPLLIIDISQTKAKGASFTQIMKLTSIIYQRNGLDGKWVVPNHFPLIHPLIKVSIHCGRWGGEKKRF